MRNIINDRANDSKCTESGAKTYSPVLYLCYDVSSAKHGARKRGTAAASNVETVFVVSVVSLDKLKKQDHSGKRRSTFGVDIRDAEKPAPRHFVTFTPEAKANMFPHMKTNDSCTLLPGEEWLAAVQSQKKSIKEHFVES